MKPIPPALPPGLPHETEYPDSDGKPLESDCHRVLMIELIETLGRRFREDPLFYVTGNLFVYYEEGEPRTNVGPDVFAVRGVPKKLRPTYKVWEEGKGPELVIELTSRKTFRRDLREKKAIYEDLGVLEYFVFDPLGELVAPRLRVFRRVGTELREEPALVRVDGSLVAISEYLGLELHARDGTLRWVDPATGEALPTPTELGDLAESEHSRAEAERARAEAAMARVEALERENERLRRSLEGGGPGPADGRAS